MRCEGEQARAPELDICERRSRQLPRALVSLPKPKTLDERTIVGCPLPLWGARFAPYNNVLQSSKVAVIDLFAGAGGMSVGAHQAGARVAASIEWNKFACETMRANPIYHGKVIEADITTIDGADLRKLAGVKVREPLIIVGGPPCQPFSKAAYWTESGEDAAYRRARAAGIDAEKPAPPTQIREDDRRDLVKWYMRLVIESKADGFFFENVPSLKHPRNRPLFDAIIKMATDAGYEIATSTCNAASYGVPQARERVVILGSRQEVPSIPAATHNISADSSDPLLKPVVTAEDAFRDLPSNFEPEEVITGRWAKHLAEVPPGWNYKAHTAWAGHPNPTFVTETRFWNFLLKLSPTRPSWTLAASPGPWTGPFHWENRRLRTEEMCALQGFPVDYKVTGNRRERVRQMGNAVPVPLARIMTEAVLKTLR